MFELIKELHEGFQKLDSSTETLAYFASSGIKLLSSNGACTGAVCNTGLVPRMSRFQISFNSGSILRCNDYFARTGTSDLNVECCIVSHATDTATRMEDVLILSTEDFINLDDDTIFQYSTMYKDFDEFYKSFVYTNEHILYIDMETITMKKIIETINGHLWY